MALLLADGVDDVGEHVAVAGRASILRSLLVSSAQLLVFVVEIAAGGIVTTVGICIYRIARGFESGLFVQEVMRVERGQLTVSGRKTAA